jgi:hypothetical protein
LAILKESPAMDENRVAGSNKEVEGAAKEADKAVGKIHKYGSGLNDAARDAEAMKSAGLLVASSIERDAEP